jgi:Domain of unknown function (DUF4184)
MPFTLAHPIAAYPLWKLSRQRLNLLGLIVGTIVPDLAYFRALRPIESFGHTLPGAMTQGLFEGLLLCAIVQYGLMRPLLAVMPPVISQRCQIWQQHQKFNVDNFVILVISIWLGAGSHLFWDSFTHPTGWFVEHFPVLAYPIGRLPLYKLLQYGSGLLGLVGLGFWAMQSKVSVAGSTIETLSSRGKTIARLTIGLMTVLLMVLAIGRNANPGEGGGAIVVRAIIGAISGSFVGLGLDAIGLGGVLRL